MYEAAPVQQDSRSSNAPIEHNCSTVPEWCATEVDTKCCYSTGILIWRWKNRQGITANKRPQQFPDDNQQSSLFLEKCVWNTHVAMMLNTATAIQRAKLQYFIIPWLMTMILQLLICCLMPQAQAIPGMVYIYPANERRSQPQWGANICCAGPIIPQDLHETLITSIRRSCSHCTWVQSCSHWMYVGTFLQTCTVNAKNTMTNVRRRCSCWTWIQIYSSPALSPGDERRKSFAVHQCRTGDKVKSLSMLRQNPGWTLFTSGPLN